MSNQSSYSTTFKMTSNTGTFFIDIPIDFDSKKSYFKVTKVLGQSSSTVQVVRIHSRELNTPQIHDSLSDCNDLIEQCIISTVHSCPIDITLTSDTIGFKTPLELEYNPNISFVLKDEADAPIQDSNLEYLFITLTFYTIE